MNICDSKIKIPFLMAIFFVIKKNFGHSTIFAIAKTLCKPRKYLQLSVNAEEDIFLQISNIKIIYARSTIQKYT